jgi:hypothetical protein
MFAGSCQAFLAKNILVDNNMPFVSSDQRSFPTVSFMAFSYWPGAQERIDCFVYLNLTARIKMVLPAERSRLKMPASIRAPSFSQTRICGSFTLHHQNDYFDVSTTDETSS